MSRRAILAAGFTSTLVGALLVGAMAGWPASKHHREVDEAVIRADVAAATYYGLNTLDCDGSNELTAPCQDELQNVNVGPRVESVDVKADGLVVVSLVFAVKYVGQERMTVTFTPDGRYRLSTG